jgi:hypothetical protein
MTNEVIVRDQSIRDLIPIRPCPKTTPCARRSASGARLSRPARNGAVRQSFPLCLPASPSVILVLSVERSKRVEAIKALPPVVAALNQTAIGRLRAMERGREDGMPDDVNITKRPGPFD